MRCTLDGRVLLAECLEKWPDFAHFDEALKRPAVDRGNRFSVWTVSCVHREYRLAKLLGGLCCTCGNTGPQWLTSCRNLPRTTMRRLHAEGSCYCCFGASGLVRPRLPSLWSILRLFLAVVLGMSLCCFFSMPSSVERVPHRCVSMVSCLLVIPRLVMFSGFRMVPCDMRSVFCCLLVVFRSLLRHRIILLNRSSVTFPVQS
jgi:hypothetical protein